MPILTTTDALEAQLDHLRAAPDARAAVTILAKSVVEIIVRTAPIYEVVRRASADPDVDALLRETRRRRRVDQRHLVEILAQCGHLRRDLKADAAADILYGLVNEELVSLFMDDCGWSAKRLREWLTAVLLDQLTAGPKIG